jgi:hypothetical protein
MKEAIVLLRKRAEELKHGANQYPAVNAFAVAKEYTDAAELLEKLTTSTANQIAPASPPSTQLYAQEDALWTMARYVGLSDRLAKHFIGLILYIKELEDHTSKEAST